MHQANSTRDKLVKDRFAGANVKDDLQPVSLPVYFKTSVGATKIFDITFYPQSLRAALSVCCEKDFPETDEGKRFLDQVTANLQRSLNEEIGLEAPKSMVRTALLRSHATKVFEKIVYRLDDKIVNRLLSIITSGQIAAERYIRKRLALPQQNLRQVKRDIFSNYPELERDVLDIGAGRRAGSRNKPRSRAELDRVSTDHKKEIETAMCELYSRAGTILQDPSRIAESNLKSFVIRRTKRMDNVEVLLTCRTHLVEQMRRKRSTLNKWLKESIDLDLLATRVIKASGKV